MNVASYWFSVVCIIISASSLLAGEPAGQARSADPQADHLEAWLEQTPAIRKHLSWLTGDGKRLHYDDWTPAMKSRLDTFYRKLLAGDRKLGMHLPHVEKNQGQVFFPTDVAWDTYAAHAAHVIYVEAKHLVPWSIQRHAPAELDQLLASDSYFARIRPSERKGYPANIMANRDFTETPENHGLAEMISDPRIGYEFLCGKTSATHKSLIGPDEVSTLRSLTMWLRENVKHGPIDGKWRERANVYRWLDERLHAFPGDQTAIAIVGCHSASKLMVDLARSVNIPLLHTRNPDNMEGDSLARFFGTSHGGLVYGWAGSAPKVVWHTDDLYARPGTFCFPIDDATGKLLDPEQAEQLYFDLTWVSPEVLARAGFVFHLQRITPNMTAGENPVSKSEDRWDYGTMAGRWKKKGVSHLDWMYESSQDYATNSLPLLNMQAHGIVDSQMRANITKWRGDFSDEELPFLHPVKEYDSRALAGMKAVGGPEKFAQLMEEWHKRRGGNLMVPGVTYERP